MRIILVKQKYELKQEISYNCTFSQGAPLTFSKMAYCGFSLNNTSHAARNVSPEHPLSSISFRLLLISILKFLQLVPATNILKGGTGFSCPYTSRGGLSTSLIMSGYNIESKLQIKSDN